MPATGPAVELPADVLLATFAELNSNDFNSAIWVCRRWCEVALGSQEQRRRVVQRSKSTLLYRHLSCSEKQQLEELDSMIRLRWSSPDAAAWTELQGHLKQTGSHLSCCIGYQPLNTTLRR